MSGTVARRRFPWWIYGVALVLILAFALWPVASVATAGWIAESNGCQADEGSIHPCIVNGTDLGPTVYTLGVMGWFMLATIPLGGIALLVWLLVLLVHYLAYRRAQRTVP